GRWACPPDRAGGPAVTGEHRTRTNRQAVHACTEECCAYAAPGWEREYEREAADQYAEQAGLNRPRAERVEAAAEYRRLLAAAQALRPTAGDGLQRLRERLRAHPTRQEDQP